MAQKKSKKPYAVKFHLTHAWTKDTIGKVTHFSIGKLKWRRNSIKVSVDSSTEEIQPHDCTYRYVYRNICVAWREGY